MKLIRKPDGYYVCGPLVCMVCGTYWIAVRRVEEARAVRCTRCPSGMGVLGFRVIPGR